MENSGTAEDGRRSRREGWVDEKMNEERNDLGMN